jgi:hypothetical protein
MFDEITDDHTQNALEAQMQYPRNKRPVFDANSAMKLIDLHCKRLMQENEAKKALKLTDSDGCASMSVHAIEAFKFLLAFHFEMVRCVIDVRRIRSKILVFKNILLFTFDLTHAFSDRH